MCVQYSQQFYHWLKIIIYLYIYIKHAEFWILKMALFLLSSKFRQCCYDALVKLKAYKLPTDNALAVEHLSRYSFIRRYERRCHNGPKFLPIDLTWEYSQNLLESVDPFQMHKDLKFYNSDLRTLWNSR